MIFKDYYKILGFETNRVTDNDIKIAFREQAKKYHPDVNVGNKNYEERFKDINEAYRTLSNPTAKRKYDRIWVRNVGRQRSKAGYEKFKTDNMANSVFQMFFGDSTGRAEINEPVPYKGGNVETSINITVQEAFNGVEKLFTIKLPGGKSKSITIKIPSGIQNNEKIKIKGQGYIGRNGGNNGDLLVKVNIVNDNKFILQGCDVISYLNITPWESALSCKIPFKGINEDINVFVPTGIQSGERIIIPNRGYKKNQNERGNLILDVRIMLPKHISNEQRELYKSLAKISNFNPRQ